MAPPPPRDELVHLGLSPWSLLARWALTVVGHPVTYTAYSPGPGELLLRLRLGWPSGPLSVPVLFRHTAGGGGAIREARDIARYGQTAATAAAAAAGAPPPPVLFPSPPAGGANDPIDGWADAAQEVLSYGRASTLSAVAEREEGAAAMASVMPAALRRLPGAVLHWVARRSLVGMVAKYPPEVDRAAARARLGELQAAVRGGTPAASGCVYLVGDAFTYADIAMVIATGVIRPLGKAYLDDTPLAALKAMTSDESFGEGLDEVLVWRDAILAKHFADSFLA